jgi:hypothetical protein
MRNVHVFTSVAFNLNGIYPHPRRADWALASGRALGCYTGYKGDCYTTVRFHTSLAFLLSEHAVLLFLFLCESTLAQNDHMNIVL